MFLFTETRKPDHNIFEWQLTTLSLKTNPIHAMISTCICIENVKRNVLSIRFGLRLYCFVAFNASTHIRTIDYNYEIIGQRRQQSTVSFDILHNWASHTVCLIRCKSNQYTWYYCQFSLQIKTFGCELRNAK